LCYWFGGVFQFCGKLMRKRTVALGDLPPSLIYRFKFGLAVFGWVFGCEKCQYG
jgi:hypothetical protein